MSRSEPRPRTFRLRRISSSIAEASDKGSAPISSTEIGGGKLVGSGTLEENHLCSLI